MIDRLDFRIDGGLRCTTTREAKESGTFSGRNDQEIWGRTKTFGVIRMPHLPIFIEDNTQAWRAKIDKITVNAEYDIEVTK